MNEPDTIYMNDKLRQVANDTHQVPAEADQAPKIDTKLKRLSQMYDLKRIDSQNKTMSDYARSLKKKTVKYFSNYKSCAFLRRLLVQRIPILDWLPRYKFKSYFLPDLIAGLTVGIMNIPQGLAYSTLAKLPAVNGFYISCFPLIIYSIFGTSRHLAIGAYAVVSLLTGDVIEKFTQAQFSSIMLQTNSSGSLVSDIWLTADNTSTMTTKLMTSPLTIGPDIIEAENKYRVQVATSLTLLIGIIQFLMGFFGLGIVTSYFSESFISSYTSASAVHVFVSQIKDLLGIKNAINFHGTFKIPQSIFDLCSKLPNSNWQTIVVSVICIVFLYTFKEYIKPLIKKRIKFEFPTELIIVVIATVASYFLNFKSYNIKNIGNIPKGLPAIDVPDISLWIELFGKAIIIATISFSINLSLASLFAMKYDYKVDANQELYAYGLTNGISSFFNCFPSAASLSRTSVLVSSNSKTNLSAIISALIILTVIFWLGPYFETLPTCCLASIIVVALKNVLLQVKDLFKLWKINKSEFKTWIITYLSVIILDVDIGLVIGIGISLVSVIIRDQFVQVKKLVNLADQVNTSSYFDDHVTNLEQKSTTSNRIGMPVPKNVRIMKIQNSIYFVNCTQFMTSVRKLYDDMKSIQLGAYNQAVSEDCRIEATNDISLEENMQMVDIKTLSIILDFSAVNYFDTNAVKMLVSLIESYAKLNCNIFIVNPQDNFIRIVYSMGKLEKFDSCIYLTIDCVLNDLQMRNELQTRTTSNSNDTEILENEIENTNI